VSQPKRKERRAEVKGISGKTAIKRYGAYLEDEFNAGDIADSGQYVLLHKRIKLPEKRSIDIIIYTTDRIYVSGSAYIEEADFGSTATRIIQLAQQATTPLEQVRPISVQQAKCILDFAEKLNLGDGYQRMVAIILSDTCNEIVLREQMKALKIQGVPLDAGIPEKIERIKDKGYAVVAEGAMKDLRETRNRVVHYGDVPHEGQATEALKVARKVLKSVSEE
jgi:hypothetical protein